MELPVAALVPGTAQWHRGSLTGGASRAATRAGCPRPAVRPAASPLLAPPSPSPCCPPPFLAYLQLCILLQQAAPVRRDAHRCQGVGGEPRAGGSHAPRQPVVLPQLFCCICQVVTTVERVHCGGAGQQVGGRATRAEAGVRRAEAGG